jgi:F-type H+-transporting ATPase subunit c
MKLLKVLAGSLLFLPLTALASDHGSDAGTIALAVGFTITLSAIGGAFAQGKAASVALDGIARNPGAADKLFTPMIIGLALIESLVIYAFVISFLLLGKF